MCDRKRRAHEPRWRSSAAASAGLTAAHELAERGFEVVVLEARDIPGGKARSLPVPGSGDRRPRRPAGRARLPLLPGLLSAPPGHDAADPAGGGTVLDRLTGATRVLLAQAGGATSWSPPRTCRESLDDLAVVSRFLFEVTTAARDPAAASSLC